MTGRVLEGGCACGRLRFRAEGEPKRVGLCHCMTCRKISGSPFGAFAMYDAGRVTMEGPHRSWAEGETRRSFCPECGSRVFSTSGDEVEIGLGALDEPNRLAPTYELWVIRKEHWLHTGDLVAHAGDRGDG